MAIQLIEDWNNEVPTSYEEPEPTKNSFNVLIHERVFKKMIRFGKAAPRHDRGPGNGYPGVYLLGKDSNHQSIS